MRYLFISQRKAKPKFLVYEQNNKDADFISSIYSIYNKNFPNYARSNNGFPVNVIKWHTD